MNLSLTVHRHFEKCKEEKTFTKLYQKSCLNDYCRKTKVSFFFIFVRKLFDGTKVFARFSVERTNPNFHFKRHTAL